MAANAKERAVQLLRILHGDMGRLTLIDDYERGVHAKPYIPSNADDEYKALIKRATTNWMPLLVSTPAQALYVDLFRPGRVLADGEDPTQTVEMKHWQRSRLDARQIAVHRGALKFGHSFVLTERTNKGVLSKGLSAKKTAALFADPANDIDPLAALTILSFPPRDSTDGRGTARMWDEDQVHDITWKAWGDAPEVTITASGKHGNSSCPVTRFAALVDLEGRTVGVVEPWITIQDRINQTVFDLLLAQTYAAVKVRYVSGMAPPIQRNPDGTPRLDDDGNPMPVAMNHNAKRFLFAEDADTKFGSLDETPLGGFIEAIDLAIRQLSALTQTPPHYLLGQIANLSAEALAAAELALSRKVQEFAQAFGESWERVFNLAAELEGVASAAQNFQGEVIWRDVEQKSLAQSADALGKLREQLAIPARGLWERVPGVTSGELAEWERLHAEEHPDETLAEVLLRSTGNTSTVNQPDLTDDEL